MCFFLEVLVSLNKSIRNYFSTISVWWVVVRNRYSKILQPFLTFFNQKNNNFESLKKVPES